MQEKVHSTTLCLAAFCTSAITKNPVIGQTCFGLLTAYLLILQVELLGNLHALEPADIASLISSLVEGFFEGLGLVQGHHMQRVPGTPGQNV